MNEECGFRLHNLLCCCEDMKCYGMQCAHIDDIICCPVHFDPDETGNKKSRLLKIDILKQEIDDLKAHIELQQKIIDKLAHSIVDPCFGEGV